ncbi:MAG: DUF1285 domain-containing protein [Rhodospirillaceae bacterium]|nr:DUF1285 domain-containing protein [Rhodospirillaceae bacterium]
MPGDGPEGASAPAGIETTPRQVIFGDIGMRIDHDGVWHYRGTPINRPQLVKLFASVLRRDTEGQHWLITPAEIAPVSVEDTPFVVVGMEVEGTGHNQVIDLRTNIDTCVGLDRDHPLLLNADSIPYVTLDGGLEAKLNRPVYYDVVSLGVEEKRKGAHILGIWSGGVFHHLGSVDDEA